MTDITLLDGGMGQELVHRSGVEPTALWSTRIMMDHPELVRDVHDAFFAAGATVATANTYAIHRDRLARGGLEAQHGALLDTAMDLALQARAAHGSGRVAGSIGPLVASYRPDVHPDHATALPLYAEVAQRIAPTSDMIIAETVASIAQARAMLEAISAAGRPAWIAFTVDDEDGTKLRSGEPVADAASACAGADAILINCSAPEVIPAALDAIAPIGLPFGAYANGFTQITKDFLKEAPTVDALTARDDVTPTAYAQQALGWIAQGATIIGGCCEIGPSHIAALKAAIEAKGHRIV